MARQYGVALLGVIVAAAVRYWLGPTLGDAIPVVMFTVPVAISAFQGGFGPALFATVLSALVSNYLFIRPYYSLRIEDRSSGVVVLTFLVIGIILSLLGRRLSLLQDQALNQARQLQAENERKDEFLAMLAHELRNPLAGISTAGQLLKFVSHDKQRLTAASDVISRQVEHMTKMVDDLLDVSRLTRGLVILDKHFVDMNDVAHRAIDQTQGMFDAKGHQLSVELPDQPACVLGDTTRLVQAVANLLGNAAKYTPAGGIVTLTVRVDGAKVSLQVHDNGVGLSPELLPRVFEPFIQAERQSDRSQGGLGLGLAMVEKITQLHDGTVAVYSAGLSQGSTFTICLPYRKMEALPNNATSQSKVQQVVAVGDATQVLNLMIVDDNRDAAHGLANLLEQQGHAVVIAYDARQALDMVYAHNVDVFLLDIGLPDVDGYELVRLLRLVPHLTTAKFVAISGYGRNEDKARAREAGFHHHFTKPADLSRLTATLREISAEH